MASSPLEQFRSYRSAVPIGFALLIMICAPAVMSQQTGGVDPDPGDPGTGGRNTVQGMIFLPGGTKLDHRVKVKLTGLGVDVHFQFSDDNGAFTFRRLQGGRYTVVVDAGADFEIASEPVDIIEAPTRRRGDPGITVSVYVTLQPKRSASAPVGTVDARTAEVSEAAKNLYEQALQSARTGDKKKAIDELQKALEVSPNFVPALNELGVIYMDLRDWKKASDPLQKAIKLAPDAFHPHLNYGIVLIQAKQYKDAADELRVAVQKDGSSGIANYYLGRAMVSMNSFNEAERFLKQAIAAGGSEVTEAHRYLGAVYIEKRDGQKAADELDAYLKLAPKAKDADKIRAIVKDLRSQASK